MIGRVELAGGALATTRIGLGCARLFGGLERLHSLRMLDHAYRLGIRHFDTAPSYGHGRSEDLVGAAFGSAMDVTITTKVGLPRPDGAPSLAQVAKRMVVRRALSRMPALKRRLLAARGSTAVAANSLPLDPGYVRQSLDESRERLRRDKIDLFCIHEPDRFALDPALLATFDALKAEGAIAAHGLAHGRAVPDATPGWDVLQGGYDPAIARRGQDRVFHGVLRHGDGPAAARLADAMRRFPNALFLVSASEPHQLTDLVIRIAETAP